MRSILHRRPGSNLGEWLEESHVVHICTPEIDYVHAWSAAAFTILNPPSINPLAENCYFLLLFIHFINLYRRQESWYMSVPSGQQLLGFDLNDTMPGNGWIRWLTHSLGCKWALHAALQATECNFCRLRATRLLSTLTKSALTLSSRKGMPSLQEITKARGPN